MSKPEPYIETKAVMNFIDMCGWIDEKYNINQRDYAKHFGFNWPASLVELTNIPLERAKILYGTKPADMSLDELAAVKLVEDARKKWAEEHPYRDFWHFQMAKVMPHNFSNDTYSSINIPYQLSVCEEDWQREIAQLWVDEFGEYADENGNIKLWVSW